MVVVELYIINITTCKPIATTCQNTQVLLMIESEKQEQEEGIRSLISLRVHWSADIYGRTIQKKGCTYLNYKY